MSATPPNNQPTPQSETPETDSAYQSISDNYRPEVHYINEHRRFQKMTDRARKLELQRNKLLTLCESYKDCANFDRLRQLDGLFDHLKKELGLK